MANLKIELQGDDVIDNAAIFLEDPNETNEIKLDPDSNTDWKKEIGLPVNGALDFSLHVLAFSGTHFTCTITNTDTGKKIEFEGTTGGEINNKAIIKGSENFK